VYKPRTASIALPGRVFRLIPDTAAPFGVRYAFDSDPDGSYGYYNRLVGEALASAEPARRSRLLRAYGGRWVLGDQTEVSPLTRPVTGFEVAGRRLLLSELAEPVAELRWAGREYRRASLSGAIELVGSGRFHPETDVVLPGPEDRDPPPDAAAPARLSVTSLRPDRAAADLEVGRAGHVIFARTYFRAWKARLDGRAVPVLVANARDLAVPVTPGRHQIEFFYDRVPFHGGALLQAAAFLMILIAAAWRRPAPPRA